MPTHNMKCKACSATSTETVKAADYPWSFSACACGGERTIDYASWGQTSRRADNYSPITFGGQRFATREDWENHRKMWKATHNEDLHVESQTKASKAASIDAIRQKNLDHFLWEQKYRGFDNEKRIRELYSY